MTPTIIIGAGNSATGKTTHLLEVARKLENSFWIDKDTIEDTFLRRMEFGASEIKRYISHNGTLARKEQHHLEHVELQAYLYMLEEARNNVRLGKHPILDGNYVRELRNNYYQDVLIPFFKDTNCKIKVIYFYAPEQVVRKRIIARNAPRDKKKIESDEAWQSFLEAEPMLISELKDIPHLLVDTTLSVEINVQKILEYLRK